ncbi:MAG: cyclase family protein [Betaproteobacteria bacterium]|nr:cyclase family protein [Betaproteobacteria bacterium]
MFQRRFLSALAALAITGAATAQDCKPSKWGPNDEIGAANYITAKSVLAATKLVKMGQTHPLGIVIEPGMPAFPPRTVSLQIVSPGQNNGRDLTKDFGWPAAYNDDLAQLWFGVGPKLGTDKVPPMVARGVLIDMAKHFKVASMAPGQAITPADIDAAMKAQGVQVREGDVVLLHTGYTDAKLKSDPKTWVSTQPGLTNAATVHLAKMNPMAVGADTWGLEAVPPIAGDRLFYGHVTLLKENGIYILETMNTGRLAQEGVKEFMFVLGQARIKGTVQMMINPVAMW